MTLYYRFFLNFLPFQKETSIFFIVCYMYFLLLLLNISKFYLGTILKHSKNSFNSTFLTLFRWIYFYDGILASIASKIFEEHNSISKNYFWSYCPINLVKINQLVSWWCITVWRGLFNFRELVIYISYIVW